jgi:hypothetical protein
MQVELVELCHGGLQRHGGGYTVGFLRGRVSPFGDSGPEQRMYSAGSTGPNGHRMDSRRCW